ncbi:Hypothetical predicted protein [Mytilus galloprovincialis]|uniref:Uncharacterized protein n=1 Tax=Mytilus galloprovincialis TaxID=29158 RepID=A0A8B6CDP4_MYTGA|nr:Hypothetical predicted protein [Mytilus galloprovincialis]
MDAMFSNGHAEKAPPLPNDTERWYLPIFGVYHHRKKDKVRVVFDSAAKCNGVSLNDVLLPGPDLTNSLLGILLRFRLEPVAVVADIQQMFYSFKVDEHHRDYLRFLWHEQYDINKPLTEYRMCVHIFGNTASPSIASYGLKQSAMRSNLGSDVTHFVLNDFYVDDGLTSLPTATKAVNLLINKKTQEALITEGKLRLHKIASNREREDRPYSRRGVLSTINSIFDPLGFLAPVVVEGRLIQRQLINSTSDWDQPLPTEYFDTWNRWTSSLQELDQLHIRRTYLSDSFSKSEEKSVHIFCDASEKAIAAVSFVRARNNAGQFELGFLHGKSKVAPVHGHTIPRLELCSAVLATEIADTIAHQLQLPLKEFKFYTDSKVVLGYII